VLGQTGRQHIRFGLHLRRQTAVVLLHQLVQACKLESLVQPKVVVSMCRTVSMYRRLRNSANYCSCFGMSAPGPPPPFKRGQTERHP
jgi:hypothetical protein